MSVYYRARVQELSIPMHKKLGKNGKGLAWLSRDLLAKIKENKQAGETGTGTLGYIEGCCSVVQGWGQEGQGAAGIEFRKGCKE